MGVILHGKPEMSGHWLSGNFEHVFAAAQELDD
jgi:hypothetical protein